MGSGKKMGKKWGQAIVIMKKMGSDEKNGEKNGVRQL